MNFTEAVQSCFSNYVGFEGRARRSEYWYFFLFNFAVSALVNVLAQSTGFDFLSGICTLALFLPSLAVAIRRLHDTGHTGWLYLIIVIPCIGWCILIYFLVQDSQPGINQYGPNPKETDTIVY